MDPLVISPPQNIPSPNVSPLLSLREVYTAAGELARRRPRRRPNGSSRRCIAVVGETRGARGGGGARWEASMTSPRRCAAARPTLATPNYLRHRPSLVLHHPVAVSPSRPRPPPIQLPLRRCLHHHPRLSLPSTAPRPPAALIERDGGEGREKRDD
jgi:hypothetical protein